MDTNSIQNSAGDSLMKNKRRRKKANKTDELLNMNQMDDALEVPHIGKICTAAVNDLQNNLMELGSQSQAEQSQIVTKPIELHAGQTVLRKKKKREQKKMEAKIEGEHQSVDQMDDHLEVPAIGKLCNDVQNKLIVLDSTAQWHVEQSKMDRRSTENITEGTVLSKNKKKKQKKKKAKNEAELRSVDQMDDHYIGKICTGTNSDLQNNFVELDSTALLHVEQSKMNSGSSENISEGTVQRKKRKRKQKKEKAKNEGELQSVDPMDDQLEVPAIGKLCIVADNDLQNNLIDLDSTAQWHVERSKMDTRSTENITEGTVQRKKKEKKQKKKKDKNEGELQSVDHMDNHLEAPAIGKLCIVANNDLQNNLIELDSSEQWHVEQSKMDTRSTENITKGTAQRKRREKKQKKKKAKNESELQSVNQMDDRLEAPADNDLQNNLIELDSSAQWHVKQSKMDTRSTENITEGTTQRKKKKKKQKKNEAKNESELQSVDQMDDHLEAPAIGKLCTVANSNLQNDVIELDSTARLLVELSKIDTSSTENNTERLSKKENRKQKKKKDKNEGELHSVDIANNDLQKNIIELGLTAQLHLEQSKMDTRSIENISEGTVQKEKRKRKQKKKKAKNEGELESVDQMDDHLEVPSIGKLCIVTNNDLQNNLIELDSTAKWHVEQSKMDTRSTENTTEGTVQRKRRKQKKAKNEGELHRVNQMDDHLEAPALGKPFIVANDDLQNNLVELDSTAQFNTKEAKMGTRSTKNLSEGIAQRKRSWRKQNEMRANTKDERQSVGIMSNLNLPDVTHGVGNGTKVITNESTTSLLHLVHDTMKPVGLNKNKASLAPVDIDSKSYSEFLELRSAPMERPREMEVEMFSCKSRHIPLPHEMSSKNEKIENEFKKEENIVHQGKDSAACSSCDVAVTKHLSSPILKEDHLSNDSFLGIAPVASVRRKLLVLDVNGLLADIVMPAPKDSVADTRLLGRAVFRRPFCNDFLKFCFENFDVAIWSSRSKKVIDIVVDYLLGDLRQKLLFCWVIFSTIIKIKGSTSKTIYFSCLNIVLYLIIFLIKFLFIDN
ncbi:Hypothetical predicted protein [Olea europaea subsp. europaea]|uniref:FCP1 homology domain-containing protein n=1 Tax=Olea europaea subsp. europaea TaxID=158383 RepID=A0A8S0RNI8_OLEEU|nr:Hypothetical predicted protein [Olea europaea subsp. europaea]